MNRLVTGIEETKRVNNTGNAGRHNLEAKHVTSFRRLAKSVFNGITLAAVKNDSLRKVYNLGHQLRWLFLREEKGSD